MYVNFIFLNKVLRPFPEYKFLLVGKVGTQFTVNRPGDPDPDPHKINRIRNNAANKID
jgi:hypothetical protein